MNHTIQYEDPVRPIYEYSAIATWAVSGAAAAAAALVAPFGSSLLFWPFVATCAAMGALRLRSATRLARQQAALEGSELTFIDLDELERITRGHEDEMFIGYGFSWSQGETQLTDTLVRNDPERLMPRQARNMGQGWIHGIGALREEPVFIPRSHNNLMSLICGTTGAGKTRLFDLMITQAIRWGDCIIVIDPKSDIGTMEKMRAATARYRSDPDREFLYFHPAFPEHSVRIDPLRNFNRPTELAARLASLISTEGSDPFVAFCNRALTTVIKALLVIGKRPSIDLLRRLFETGLDEFIVRMFEAYLDHAYKGRENWISDARAYLEAAREGGGKRQTTQAQRTALAYIAFYRAKVIHERPAGDIEGIVSDYEHDSTHYSKMTTNLLPVLTSLTSGTLGPMLSPDYEDLDDERPIIDLGGVIRGRKVLYIALDALSDAATAGNIGALMLADLASAAGSRYNDQDLSTPVSLFVDEAAEVVNIPMWQLLSKARGALFSIYAATQTVSDFEARMGSAAAAEQLLGNLNQVYSLRLLDNKTQSFITDTLGETVVRRISYAQMTRGDDDNPVKFTASTTESLQETEVPLVRPEMLGCLPNLEFFARISAGRVVKCRIPILNVGGTS